MKYFIVKTVLYLAVEAESERDALDRRPLYLPVNRSVTSVVGQIESDKDYSFAGFEWAEETIKKTGTLP